MAERSDHREDIRAAALSYTERTREAREGDDGLDGAVYDIEVWASNHGRRRVEFLLAGGGPTVWVEVNAWESVVFHHSWGKGPHSGEDRTEWPVVGDDADFWRGLADEYGELLAPELAR